MVSLHFFRMTSVNPITWDNHCESFQQRPELDTHIAYAAFASLKQHGKRKKEWVIDHTQGRRSMDGHTLLALAMALAKSLQKQTDDQRIAIVLPTGIGAYIANLACLLADRIPVNLNFTLGSEGIAHCMQLAEVSHVISAKAVKQRANNVPWEQFSTGIDLEHFFSTLSKTWLVFDLLAMRLLPTETLAKIKKIPTKGENSEATLLFTSGSAGTPKGVPLTHRNLMGNIQQIMDEAVLLQNDRLMATLPMFHSFGCTVLLWFPLIKTIDVVCYPNPLESTQIANVIEQEQVTVHLATPTLLRPWFKKVRPTQIKSLRAVVAGAEKTPAGFRENWENTFGSDYLEGYGLTETTPVVSCNIPKTGKRSGSVGKLFPGMAARILHPETRKPQPLEQRGLLALKGVNVFQGYLNNPEATQKCFLDGWFVTGDLATIDHEGYLYIHGRLSRFSKIGGEMVAHGKVEEAITQALALENEDAAKIAVSAREDPTRGEAIVLFTTFDLDSRTLKKKLQQSQSELPALWMPKEIRKIEQIPLLGNGKLDLKNLNEMARRSGE